MKTRHTGLYIFSILVIILIIQAIGNSMWRDIMKKIMVSYI